MPQAKLVSKDKLEKRLIGPGEISLLHFAAQSDNYDAAHDLIHHYVFSPTSKNEQGWVPIYMAAAYDGKNVFDLLYGFLASAPKTDNEANCLFIATGNGSNSIVDQILANPNRKEVLESKNMFGASALGAAIKDRHPECTRLLLRHANPLEDNSSPFGNLFPRWDLKGDGNDVRKAH